jgi:hypothetical protein
MNRTIDRLKLIFLGVFAFACVGVAVYHIGWVWPAQKCESKGDWFDWQGRVCAHPVLLSDLTGRTLTERQADAAKEKAAAAQAAKPQAGAPAKSEAQPEAKPAAKPL